MNHTERVIESLEHRQSAGWSGSDIYGQDWRSCPLVWVFWSLGRRWCPLRPSIWMYLFYLL